MAPVIIVTGASRGLGASIAKKLLSAPHSANLVLVARTASSLEVLKAEYPGQVEIVTGDVADEQTNKNIVRAAVEKFGRVDGIIFNAAILEPISVVAKSSIVEWKKLYDTNFFSLISTFTEAAPYLRESKGKIVFISSGATRHYYSGWGAYGSSKAATEHLSATIAAEEPEIISFALDPGVMDTDMQIALREKHGAEMKKSEHDRFIKLKSDHALSPPELPGGVAVNLVLHATKDLSGLAYKFNAAELAGYRD
ncbi:hypothetical protein V1514DRAFT_329997 [Lipomyces japonicus]|uniref:uncharacterized protein n=1 Tax=Lipomyces japonicus TaxID=56871 RepID=UPI0034CE1F38